MVTTTSSLFIRTSADDLTLARVVSQRMVSHRQKFNRRVSFTLNLREALAAAPSSITADVNQVEVFITAPVSVVPLSEFSESEVPTIYQATFRNNDRVRVLSDVLPAGQIALVYGAAENVCRAVAEAFPNVSYHNALVPILQSGPIVHSDGLTMVVYGHEDQTDVVLWDGRTFLALNTFTTHHAKDAAFFVLGMMQALGYEASDFHLSVVGEEPKRGAIVKALAPFVSASGETLSAGFSKLPYPLACAMRMSPSR